MRLRICVWAGLVLAVAFVTGCSSDSANRYYLDYTLPSKNPDEVAILYAEPARSYTVIADLQARGVSPKYMQKHAAEIGADAVIVSLLGGRRSYDDEWASDNTSRTYSRITGTAIIYK